MRAAFVVAVSATFLAACGPAKPAGDPAGPLAAEAKNLEQQAAMPNPAEAGPASAWLTAETALPAGPDGSVMTGIGGRPAGYALLGKPAPEFSAPLHGGGRGSLETLRGHWSILAFWGAWSSESVADAPYVSALISAANQDPDLDVLTIHSPRDPASAGDALGSYASLDSFFADKGGPWPTVLDADASVRTAFGVTWTPSYVLVAPDLTIQGFRTDLSLSPDNGVKDVIRGIAEIKGATR